jgi:hypothetical protein
MRIELDERVYQGTPLQIVQAWKAISFRPPSESLRAYMAWSVGQLAQAGAVIDDGPDVTDEQLATRLVQAFIDAGMARDLTAAN